MKFTGERYVPAEQGEIRVEHMHRYAAVAKLVAGKDVLDVACGEGYGARLIADSARSVTGVDISEEAIRHAKGAYGDRKNLAFRQGSASKLPLADNAVDVVVSFETIEHLEEQRLMLAELRRVLRHDGVLVISSPNRPVYSRGGEHHNEFHVRELDFTEMDALLRSEFPAVRYYGQKLAAGSLLQPLEGHGRALQALTDDGAAVHAGWTPVKDPVYFVAVCAEDEALLPRLEASLLQSSQSDLVEGYRATVQWAQQVSAEIERVSGLHRALDEEHQKIAAWARSLESELAAARAVVEERHETYRRLEQEQREAYRRLDEEHRKVAAWGKSLEAELAEVMKEITRKREDLLALEDERRKVLALEAESARLRKQLAETRDEKLGLEESHREASARAVSLDEQLTTLRAQFMQVREEYRVMQEQHHIDDVQAQELARLRGELAAAQARAAVLEQEAARLGEVAAQAAAQTAAREAAMRASVSWRVTAPLRVVLDGLRGLYTGGQWAAGKVFNLLPITPRTRYRIRGFFYEHAPAITRGSPPFEAWKGRRTHAAMLLPALVDASRGADVRLIGPRDRTRVPRASIVIPIHGQLDYTLRCIQSLLEARTRTTFEVIVVDDCSPDESAAILETLPAIRLLFNAVNKGFIRTCNRGALEARGEFLVFLNNDTIVHDDWLDALARTFDDFPACGLAGSKLLYPDGRLQEAGGIIWRDGSAWNYGRLDDPRKPEYCYLREADYCSGAALMIRRELFMRLGGFDEHFAPAYCEDSDLAFRVRRAGSKVYYQPLSRVTHFEGITSGTDVTRGVKAYQVENARKLAARWRDELAMLGEPGVDPHLARDRNIAGRVLVIDHCTPTPDQDAGSITALTLMRILQSFGMKVTFIPEDNMLDLERYTADMQRVGIECLYAPYVANLHSHLAEHGHLYDMVLFFRVGNSTRHLDEIELYCPQAKIVFHTSDLHFLRFERQAQFEDSQKLRDDAVLLKERELSTMRRTHATIVHSTVEKRLLDGLLGWQDDSRIFTLGWSIPIAGTTRGFRERDGILFVGGYQHGPNVDAVDYFVQEIFPRVRSQLPRARFLIVGSRAPERFRDLGVEGVEFVGFVADLAGLLDRSRMTVAPLRYGAGTKGKIYTSLSHGVPCVATSIGAEGMDLADGEEVLVADDPAGFAAHVARLHEDEALWNRLSANGYEYLKAHASTEVGRKVMAAILRHVGLEGREPRAVLPAAARPMPREALVADREQYEAFMGSKLARRQLLYEVRLIRKHSALQEQYDLEGWCEVCERRSVFHVDKIWGGQVRDGSYWEPNWRERCVCAGCQLNTRQRVIAARMREHVRSLGRGSVDAYLTEQVTPIFAWAVHNVAGVRWVGSEYFGPQAAPGSISAAGIRHEDVERLSFADASFDLVVSNDVLEHVDDPQRAAAEMLRVLRPGGVLLMTVPFHTALDRNRRRAKVTGTGLVHYLPEVYHGNPVSDDGSLVFTDFGWEFLDEMSALGYADVALHTYWAEARGYLGVGQHYIRAVKPHRPVDEEPE
jgi:GT2 family glycosyltransferase/ubiquinone/menaquinone biosynthesis C-methylase UbiE/glycosyltransferase involved in cell wall biosynthesis